MALPTEWFKKLRHFHFHCTVISGLITACSALSSQMNYPGVGHRTPLIGKSQEWPGTHSTW